jgi:hypothetical protein
MAEIKLGKDGEITLKTALTEGQIAKFRGLIEKIIIENGVPYIPINELHGVFLTTSRERARTIVNNHANIVKPYLIRDRIRFQKYGVDSVIKPIGLYFLLEKLAEEKPRRALDYRASLTLLSSIVANHPDLALSTRIQAKRQQVQRQSVIAKLKKRHKNCQLCQQPFLNNEEKHAHHIQGESEDPALANDEKNLIIIKGKIHKKYHEWVNNYGYPINRETLRWYAIQNNFSLDAL